MTNLLWLLLPLLAIASAQEPIRALMLDSSFPPQKELPLALEKEKCRLVAETNAELPKTGDCYERSVWTEIGKRGDEIARGLMDTLANVKSADAAKYLAFQQSNPGEAKAYKVKYILATHGARSASVLSHYSGGKAQIIPVRVLSAQAGAPFATHGNGCGLRKWDKKTTQKIVEGGLQPYQERIQSLLEKDEKIRVINISLGYKKSWIAEDNGKCPAEIVSAEYAILENSWRNLLRKNCNRVFVVAAGNEGKNLDEESARSDDLWASLAEEPNLLIVGSLKASGERLESSNYGSKVLMEKGEEIEAHSPLAGAKGSSHKTTLRGTSFSTPIAAGKLLKIWQEKADLTPTQVISALKGEAAIK